MSVLNCEAVRLDGSEESLNQYSGKVVLVVNTASKCGFTPQYEALEGLYKTYKDQGLEVLGFPCDQFGGQEPGDHGEIASFCQKNYGVTFPMFQKIEVNGKNAHPFFESLKKAAPGLLGSKAIKWNFTKFLLNKKGEVVERYAPTADPKSFKDAIEQLLDEA